MKRLLFAFAWCAALSATALASDNKLIALTFDDGPRPYVLLGNEGKRGLLNILDDNQAKATFFVVGWRLKPGVYGDRHEPRVGPDCRHAGMELAKHGEELENHTFSHIQLRLLEKQKGDDWSVADIDRASNLIKDVSGQAPRYFRPPDWIMTRDLQQRIEKKYTLMTISAQEPIALRDVNTEDYVCATLHRSDCSQWVAESVMKKIAAREKKGIYSHILAFHELPYTAEALSTVLPQLKARGYRFVTVSEYESAVKR